MAAHRGSPLTLDARYKLWDVKLLQIRKTVPLGCTQGAGLLHEGMVFAGSGSQGPLRLLDT